jgi:hypothetical protein
MSYSNTPVKEAFLNVMFFESYGNSGNTLTVTVVNQDGSIVSSTLKHTIRRYFQSTTVYGLNLVFADPIFCKVSYDIKEEASGTLKNNLFVKTGIVQSVSVIDLAKKYPGHLVDIKNISVEVTKETVRTFSIPFKGELVASGQITFSNGNILSAGSIIGEYITNQDEIKFSFKKDKECLINIKPTNSSFLPPKNFVIYEV